MLCIAFNIFSVFSIFHLINICFCVIPCLSCLGLCTFWTYIAYLLSIYFFCGFLSCFFLWNMLIVHLIFSDFLCLWCPIFRLQDCSSSCFWCLPLVGELGPGACAGYLVGSTGAYPLSHCGLFTINVKYLF